MNDVRSITRTAGGPWPRKFIAMPESPVSELDPTEAESRRSTTASPAPKFDFSTAIQQWAPLILLLMGVVLFIATLVVIWTEPATAGELLGGAIVCVVLSVVINESDELELVGLFRWIRRRGR
jgi:hypothetical protein